MTYHFNDEKFDTLYAALVALRDFEDKELLAEDHHLNAITTKNDRYDRTPSTTRCVAFYAPCCGTISPFWTATEMEIEDIKDLRDNDLSQSCHAKAAAS